MLDTPTTCAVAVGAAVTMIVRYRRHNYAQTLHDAFRTDGFVRIPGFLDAEAVRETREELRRILDEELAALPDDMKFYEDVTDHSSLKQLQAMHKYSPHFAALFEGPLRRLAEACLGGDVIGQNLQFFNKPTAIRVRDDTTDPVSGANERHHTALQLRLRSRPTPPHQDGSYFHLEPCLALTGWLALDDADERNGALHYAHGSHRMAERNAERYPNGLLEHEPSGVLGFSRRLPEGVFQQHVSGSSNNNGTGVRMSDWEPTCMVAAAGDLVAHNAQMVHWAGANRCTRPDRQRRAVGFIYYARCAQHDADAAAAYQARIANEWREKGKL